MKIVVVFFLALQCCFSSVYGQPKVYDCFLFLNELEILDIRLHEMDDVVDKFVLLESVETFRGDPKPLFFAENAARFAQFADKIIHIVFDQTIPTPNPWRREFSHRDSLLRGLLECDEDDIVMISDVDEIVSKEGVLAMVEAISSGEHEIVGATQRYHTVFLNSEASVWWRGTVATTYAQVKEQLPQGLRHIKDWVPAVATGWHFTWQGGIDQVLYKMGSYSHWESDTPEDRERTEEEYRLKDKFPRAVPLDNTFPQYIIDNQAYFESIGYVMPVEEDV